MICTRNRSYIEEKHYNNAKDFLTAISYGGELYDFFERNFIFRGHATTEYKLIPSALRGNLYIENWKNKSKGTLLPSTEEQLIQYSLTEHSIVATESRIIQDFFQLCDANQLYIPEIVRLRETFSTGFDIETYFKEEKWLPKEYYEIAAIAQHYGLKTRLLDWTYDIDVALYFASIGSPQQSIRVGLGEIVSEPQIEIWALDTSVIYAIKGQDIPLKIINPRHYRNDNMSAQRGCFTLWEIEKCGIDGKHVAANRHSLDELITDYLILHNVEVKPYLYHITLPQKDYREIYKFAKRNNADAAHLFPGYEGVVRCINEDAKML